MNSLSADFFFFFFFLGIIHDNLHIFKCFPHNSFVGLFHCGFFLTFVRDALEIHFVYTWTLRLAGSGQG